MIGDVIHLFIVHPRSISPLVFEMAQESLSVCPSVRLLSILAGPSPAASSSSSLLDRNSKDGELRQGKGMQGRARQGTKENKRYARWRPPPPPPPDADATAVTIE